MCTLKTLFNIFFIVYNAVLLLLGIGCVTLAIIVLIRLGELRGISDFIEEFKGQSITCGIFILGLLMIITCVIGCLASGFDSHLLAISHSILMLLLLIVTVILSVSLHADISASKGLVSKKMDEYWNKRSKNDTNSALPAIEYVLKCCGKNGPDDYESEEVPTTCCPKAKDKCTVESAYNEGCESKINNFFRKYSKPVGYMCLIIILFVFVGFILGIYLILFLYYKV